MKDKDVLKLFLKNGWQEVSVKGSHHKLRKEDNTEIIPVHGRELAPGLLNVLLKRNGFTK
ncbi:MAG: type II toxin-antitoxin system HicA family toxin [Selenomonadaceae bacterium]|nr:type II toxin-antitoxin system HicA family toxin [Selenomonadaceae bacterium]